MSMTYIVVAFGTVLLNNVFLSLFSFKVRILFGYMISLSTFLFVSICEVAIEVFSVQTAYAANLAAVSLTAIGCTGMYLFFISGNAVYLTIQIVLTHQYNSPAFTDSPVCSRNSTRKRS